LDPESAMVSAKPQATEWQQAKMPDSPRATQSASASVFEWPHLLRANAEAVEPIN